MHNAASLSLLFISLALAQADDDPNAIVDVQQAATASVPAAAEPMDERPTPALTADDLVHWKYASRVVAPPSDDSQPPARWQSLVLPASVLGASRQDLSDLRLLDSQDHEIPFVVRTLRTVSESRILPATLFNDGVVDGNKREIRLDIGETPTTHSQIEIDMEGREFRRDATLSGSDDGQTWTQLGEGRLVRFRGDSNDKPAFEQRTLRYSPSRFRYLRVQIASDRENDRDKAPEVQSATLYHRVEVKGEDVEWPVTLETRLPTRTQNVPSSTWTIVLPESSLPVDYLLLDIPDSQFSRDYQLEAYTDGIEPWQSGQVAAGTLQRTERSAPSSTAPTPLRIEAAQVHASRLKLHLLDHGNAPISIDQVRAFAAVRELIFEHDSARTGDLRLVYGNPQATGPYYDLERTLPESLVPPPQRQLVEERQENPRYLPPPVPMSERVPWLIYVVLGATSAVVALILADVGRRAIRLHDAQTAN